MGVASTVSRNRPPHPLLDWSECMSRYSGTSAVLHILGSTLILVEANVEGLPPLTLVHPRGVSSLRVNGGGGFTAWEPLDPPVTSCTGRPLHDPIWESKPAINPLNWDVNLLIPLGDGSLLHVRGRQFDRLTYSFTDKRPQGVQEEARVGGVKVRGLGRCAPLPSTGWHACEGGSVSGGREKAFTAGPIMIETPCFELRAELLHPGGFVNLGRSWGLIEGNIVHFSCPRTSFYVASPNGLTVERRRDGVLLVDSGGVTVVGSGERIEAVKLTASLNPPPVSEAWVLPRGAPLCMISRCQYDSVTVSAWNPLGVDSLCEVLFRVRVAGVRISDPAGEAPAEARGGIVRVPVPSYTWVNVEAQRDTSLAERLRRLRVQSRAQSGGGR